MKMMVILLAVRLQRIINLDNLVALVRDVNTKQTSSCFAAAEVRK